ncbi:uncharacterized protein KGF55_000957 [Candida pseudojiufengensis]|uniref:uncharacterized protein n=1 Tax=Candida pseudojiufengensis TaxID=497109 RepID=UPI002224E091|nr:uncharacterized protein KGF55_000957 [Candida pseudojiufengensis]KAI5965595.1 hypothetical protein KGF55_000957 [Candida pseudojiufengensis]
MSTLFNRQPSTQFFNNNNNQFIPQQSQQQQTTTNTQPQLFQARQPQQVQPAWLQSQHNQKKRVIPNHLVPHKKSNFQINAPSSSKSNKNANNQSSSSMLVSNDQFNIVSFGNNRKHTIGNGTVDRSLSALFDSVGGDLSRFDETMNESFQEDDTLLKNNENQVDAPPLRSMYDLNEDSFGLSKPARKLSNSINKDPKTYNNLFTRFEANEDKVDKDNKGDEKKKAFITDLDSNAIIVFGYSENASIQIIQFFKQFGTILEKFTDISNSTESANLLSTLEKEQTNVDIFTGPNWIKITYDNHNSTLNALQENGSVFNGNLLGVVPFHKSVIEKLEKNRTFVNENIKDLSTPLKFDKKTTSNNSKLDETIITPPSSSTSNSGSNKSTYINRLDIKEGTSFFVNADEKKEENNKNRNNKKSNLNLISTISKYVFGFHDL